MPIKEKKWFYIIMMVVVSIGLFLIWQGILSSRLAISNKILQIKDKQASIKAYTQREKSLSLVLDNYADAKEKIDQINQRFVSGASSIEMGKFFGELENIAIESSVLLEKKFIANPEIAKNASRKTTGKDIDSQKQLEEEEKFLSLITFGSYENLLNFIFKLEAIPYYIDIKSLGITTRDSSQQKLSEKKDDLQAKIVIKILKKQDLDDKK